ncbi:MAG: DUF2085 domain-containing protein [Anaerolineae bacterium]|nr:DUF2085 domain-containing protein [Anaerolineae bacterium]
MIRDAASIRRSLSTQRWVLRFTRHWLKFVIIFFGLYAGLPFLAPVLMHVGATGPAQAIYTVYSPMCHQFAFRSWFLFGEQAAYPREQAGVESLGTYEQYASTDPTFSLVPDLHEWTVDLMNLSRAFIGNDEMGYKVALCERDVAIYGAIFLGSLLFSIPYVRARLRPVPLWLYVFLGLGPVGLDGFSQLLSNPPLLLWPARESTPLFRTVTGALFGLMNAWLALPHLEQAMRETLEQLQEKLHRGEALLESMNE